MTRAVKQGLTLIEVMIAIAILAIVLAIIYPNIVRQRPTSVASEATLVEQAKSLAIARAEPMRLSVSREGSWEIVSEAAPGSAPIASGQLPETPALPWRLRVTELGICIPEDAPGGARGGPVIDAVSCSLRP